MLYINLHNLYIISIKPTSKRQESRKSNKYLKSHQEDMIELLEEIEFIYISF